MSKVSIIVPIYNPGRKLNKCIRSILNQTFQDFELILVNDGSTDNSLNLCNKYKQKDKRVIVINKENEGTVATRRAGIKVSNSAYIMFVDSDDWIDKKMVETLYNEAIDHNLDISVSNTFLTLGNGIIKRENKSDFFKQEKIYDKEEIRGEILTTYFGYGDAFPASLCSKLYKKELLITNGKYSERIHFFGDDLFYNLEMLLNAKRVKIIGECFYYYRMGGFTNKFMPNYFEDIINGYQIQKEVIHEYYLDNRQEYYKRISSRLLLMFRNGLYNLFYGSLSKMEIENLIRRYVNNQSIIESINNLGSKNIFSADFINAIRNQDVAFLYSIGEDMYTRKKVKRALKNFFTSLPFVYYFISPLEELLMLI
ncbi:glycosyltransferase family 2 protein [Neobacillus drentensis]|uniref:glycosyltransferase family 2 protein n=1 Tax=Neobacillus drentensis TaxID=220684 RepID=UPI0028641063|nr:glycosyltransferase [Neobacillus drentensis]MDR7239970.1 glycosyltransferase involved in cell wall biosynthesis [Neobacillus drentensis]